MSRTYFLEQEVMIEAPVKDVWQFFSDPYNLDKISPGYMNFKIVNCPKADDIYDGMQIEYRVSPLMKIPLKWVTLIKEVQPMKCFTDIQLNGPYASWEHTHTFRETDAGTVMYDAVRYALPFGPLGTLAHRLFVKRQLADIFHYRETVIRDLFKSKKLRHNHCLL